MFNNVIHFICTILYMWLILLKGQGFDKLIFMFVIGLTKNHYRKFLWKLLQNLILIYVFIASTYRKQ